MNKKILSLVIIVFLSMLLLGCSGNEYERRNDDTNTLYVGAVASSFPTSFMPWLSRDGIAPTISSMLYSTLFSTDDETGEFLPWLAKEWYYVDLDGNPILTEDGAIDYERLETVYSGKDKKYLAVKIILHDNVKWSDGETLTVEDVYYTFDIATNNAMSNHAGALAWSSDLQHNYSNGILTKQGIFTYDHGANEKGYTITEEEKDTVMYLHVNKVLGAITSLFTTILILPEHIWSPIVTLDNQLNSKSPTDDSLREYQNPVGCGPYKLDADNSNAQVITLLRNNDFHLRDDDNDYLFKVEKIKFMLYQEENVAIYSVLKGHIDVLDSSINSNYLSLFENKDDIFISNAEGLFIKTLVFNLNPADSESTPKRDLLGNIDFRRALALAIDQDNLIDQVLNGAGSSTSAGLMLESFESFYNEEADILRGDYDQRLAEANRILDTIVPDKDKSGYRLVDGNRIDFEIIASPGEQDLISRLQVQYQKIGIDLSFKAQGSSPERTYLFSSKFDMTFQGVNFSLANADIMYRAHFVSLSNSSNYGRYINEPLASRIDTMRTSLNLNDKYDAIKDLQVTIAQSYYKIPVYSSNIISVARTDRYTGYVVDTGTNVFNNASLMNLKRVE